MGLSENGGKSEISRMLRPSSLSVDKAGDGIRGCMVGRGLVALSPIGNGASILKTASMRQCLPADADDTCYPR